MTKEDIIRELETLEASMVSIKERLIGLQNENETLHELVKHLASRPSPYSNVVSIIENINCTRDVYTTYDRGIAEATKDTIINGVKQQLGIV